MLRPAISQIINEGDSYYSFVLSIAKRARDIVEEKNANEEILIEKPVKLAVEEFHNGTCTVK